MSPQHLTSEHFESWRTRDEPPYEVLLGWFFVFWSLLGIASGLISAVLMPIFMAQVK